MTPVIGIIDVALNELYIVVFIAVVYVLCWLGNCNMVGTSGIRIPRRKVPAK